MLEAETIEIVEVLRPSRDGLTGLPKRTALGPAFEQARQRRQALAFALLDLDRFKRINDVHGFAAAIGVAFMLVEIGLLQRLSVVLGHPAFSLVVVLASLVASAGLGSLASDRLPLAGIKGRALLSLTLAALLVGVSFAISHFAPRVAPMSLPMRVAFSAGLTATLGFPMGMAFPVGMRTYGVDLAEETPWLWGINGVAGVIASSGAVMLALAHGISALFVVAAVAYAMLVPLTLVRARDAREAPGA